MIKNEKQYKMTKLHFDNFKQTIQSLEKKENTPLIQLEKDSIQSQISDLQKEIDEYDDLKSDKKNSIFELNSIDDLPKTLIKARIASGLSQKKLADLINVQERRIQRYESTNYETASIALIKNIAKVLDLDIEKNMPFINQKFSKEQFFKKIKELGLEPKFVTKYLLPAHLSARFNDPNTSPDLLGYQAAACIGRIFNFDPLNFFRAETLALDTVHVSQVKFKITKNTNQLKLNTHAAYAKYISFLILQATKHIANRKISNDPLQVRKEILDEYDTFNFETLLCYVWSCGIPVWILDSTAFHAASFCKKSKSVIVLAQKTSSEARWMFNLFHEFYHVSQGMEQIVETRNNFYNVNNNDEEEYLANQFASTVLLGNNLQKLAELCIDKSDESIAQLKNRIGKIAVGARVRSDVLANYIAFRLTSKQNMNWWAVAEPYQNHMSNAQHIVQRLLKKNIDFNALSMADLELVKHIIDRDVQTCD